MRREIYLLILSWLLATPLLAQYGQSHKTCHPDNCFYTEVIKAEKSSENCTSYEFKISYEGNCRHALSHYTVAIPCGTIKDLSNSKNWKQVIGYDPTTKLTGFKIDDIPNFGDSYLKSFTVKFTLCTDNENCSDKLKCWEPLVAYKAGTSVFYDTLETTSCPSLAANITKQDASCFGVANGSATVTVTDGEQPVTFLWSNGATTSSITNVAAGTYSVTVKDATGETLSLSTTIGQPEAIAISGTVTQASCSGQANGAINVSVTGGNGVYTYQWSNGATTEDLSSLAAGSYTLTVKDSSGCSAVKSFTISNQTVISLTVLPVLPTCNQSNGAINITVSGGTAPYTYSWSTGATTEDISGIAAGLYKVKVTDANGCSTELSYNLRDNNTLRLSATIKQTSCLDDASGAVDLVVSGGTEPYTYLWSTGATTEDISNLISGMYKVTVTDANGCTATLTANVSKKTFSVSPVITQPLCNGDATGSIVLTVTGGTEPYYYQWSNGSTSNSVTDVPPGAYSVTITDQTGCVRSIMYVINNPPAILANASVSNTQCNAEGQFAINLSVTGGKAPYTYLWSNGATTEDLSSLNSGTYTVVITDANGCKTTKQVVVTGTAAGWSCLINPADSIPMCSSTNNTLNTSVEGATYQWTVSSSDNQWIISAGANTSAITYTAGGENSSATFTLTITKDGCTQTCTYAIATCTADDSNPGGGDGGDETCEECFDSSIKVVSTDGNCITYEATVSTDGECRHDLSHWTIAIPCGTVKNYSNSEGWPIKIGQDPTTGLYGLKVDNIDDFGKTPDSFTVKFTICADQSYCRAKLNDWNPKVAYKAGTCVSVQTIDGDEPDPGDGEDGGVCAYPNPFHGDIKFSWKCKEDDYVELDIIDKCGREVRKVYKGNVYKGETYSFDCNGSNMDEDLYIYRFRCSKKTSYGKLIKRR